MPPPSIASTCTGITRRVTAGHPRALHAHECRWSATRVRRRADRADAQRRDVERLVLERKRRAQLNDAHVGHATERPRCDRNRLRAIHGERDSQRLASLAQQLGARESNRLMTVRHQCARPDELNLRRSTTSGAIARISTADSRESDSTRGDWHGSMARLNYERARTTCACAHHRFGHARCTDAQP